MVAETFPAITKKVVNLFFHPPLLNYCYNTRKKFAFIILLSTHSFYLMGKVTIIPFTL